MGQKVASLEIELAMATGGAVEDLNRFGGQVDKVTAQAIRDMDRMDAAMSNVGGLDAATASVVKLAEETAKTAVTAVRELNRIERAGEAMASQLDRQISTFGKTTAEIRAMKAETAALAAEQAGMAELAGRIRAKEQELWEAEYAAARRARLEEEAASEARAEATAAAEREAQAIRDAAAAHALFEAKVRQGAAALKEQVAAEKAAAREEAAAKLRAEAKAAEDLAASRARLAAVVRASHDAQEADAVAAERLRASTDPLYAATKRLNDEIAESTRLYHAGAMAPAEYARQQQVLAARLRETERAHDMSVKSAARSSTALTQLSFQLNDVATMAAMGAPPMQIFASQAGQILQVAQGAEGGVRGFSREIGTLALRFLPLLAVTAVAGVAFSRWHDSLNEGEPMKAYAKTLGLNQEEMKKLKDVSITNTDLIAGAWKTMVDAFGLAGKGKKLIDYLFGPNDAKEIGNFIASIYGAFVGGYRAIMATWRLFPGALADLVIQGVNKASDGIEWLVNKAIDGLNMLGLNLSHVDFGHLANSFAGQADAVAATFSAEVSRATAEAQAAINGIFAKVAANAAAHARDRLKTQAEELSADRRAKEAADAAKKAREEAERIAKFNAEMARERLTNAGQLHKEVEALMASWNKPIGVDKKGLQDLLKEIDGWNEHGGPVGQMNAELEAQGKWWDDLSRRASEAGSNMENAFGRVGGAIGRVTELLAEYGRQQHEIDTAGLTAAEHRRQSTDLQLSSMIGLTGAAKGLFSEHSKGYKAMEAAEKALTVVQLARTVIDVAGGAARMFATLGPAGFPAVAAMLAVMATLGFAGGGSSSYKPSDNDGSGTVLGDASAKSDSLRRSIELLGDIDHQTMVYSGQMLTSLRSIDDKIASFASLIARTAGINASAGVNTGFKTDLTGKLLAGDFLPGVQLMKQIPIVGDIVGAVTGVIKSLFGTKTTVVGSGLYGGAQSLGDIMAGGFDADYYSDVKKTKKFLGLSTGSKYSTKFADADPSLENQFTLILSSFAEAVAASAAPLGQATDEVERRLDSFVVNIGKIDLKDLTGEQIQEKLEAVFGAAADNIAAAAIPGLERFQQVGEGYFETLIRVASTAEAVTGALDALGRGARDLGLDAKLGLADLFDSVSDMQSSIGSYMDTFYTDAERTAARTAQLGRVFTSLNLTMPASIAGYRALVDAQDLNTEAGRQAYAQLIKLAPAFAEIATSAQDAASAAAIVRERQDLQKQLSQALGDEAAIRAAELARLDPSNRALQEQIWAIEDAKEAAKAAEQLRDAWKGVGDSIMDEVRRIRGLNDAAGGGSFASLLGRFNAANAVARSGDIDAAKSLPQLSKSLLDAAALAATSRQELDRVQAQTAAALEATWAAIGGLGGETAPASSTTASLSSLSAAQAAAGSGGSTSNDLLAELRALRAEVASMRDDNNRGHATNAGNTGAIKRKLEDVTAASGGDAITTIARAA